MSYDSQNKIGHMLAGTLFMMSAINLWQSSTVLAFFLVVWGVLTLSFVQRYSFINFRFHNIDKLFFFTHAAFFAVIAVIAYHDSQRMLSVCYGMIGFGYASRLARPLASH